MSEFLPETTKNYYQQKIDHVYQQIRERLESNQIDYEAYTNTPFAKSMIRFKFDFDLAVENCNIPYEDMINMVIEEGMDSLLYSSIIKIEPKQYRDIYISEHLPDSSASEIKSYLDYAIEYEFENEIDAQLNKIRYLYFGEKHIKYIDKIIDLGNINGYVGNYKGIKFFYIDQLEDIFISNGSFIDLNTMDVKYNEYIIQKWADMFDENVLYEEVADNMKKGVLTLNCYLGDVNIVKLQCHYGDGKTFYRKLKLSRILKNEIDI